MEYQKNLKDSVQYCLIIISQLLHQTSLIQFEIFFLIAIYISLSKVFQDLLHRLRLQIALIYSRHLFMVFRYLSFGIIQYFFYLLDITYLKYIKNNRINYLIHNK